MTRFVYGLGSELIAEYSIDKDTGAATLQKEYLYAAGMLATIEPAAGTQYTTSDMLGTPRVITSSSGSVVSRHDYMPFGFAGE